MDQEQTPTPTENAAVTLAVIGNHVDGWKISFSVADAITILSNRKYPERADAIQAAEHLAKAIRDTLCVNPDIAKVAN